MGDYSLVVLVGRLTKDPELKYGAGGGLPHARLSIAVNKQTAQADGTVKKTVSFVDAMVWRHQAEMCAQMLKKGSTVMVVGSLQQERWTDKDGKNQSRLKVTADRVQFLDRRVEAPVPLPGGSVPEAGGDKAGVADDAGNEQDMFEE